MPGQLLGNRVNQRSVQPTKPKNGTRRSHRRPTRLDLVVESGQGINESQDLEQTLHQRGCLPAHNDHQELERRNALTIVESILCEWAASIPSTSNDAQSAQPLVSLVTFGSYRLRVHRPESDLDVLAMSPSRCCRGDFFTTLVQLLQRDVRINDVHAIPSAYTPVIKFQIHNIQVDMLFGRAANDTKLLEFQQQCFAKNMSHGIGSTNQTRLEYHIDDSDLIGTDEAGVRSLNGARVTQLILETVEPNSEAFRLTLCAVKEWAITNGIYSNILGFLGGINFAIMVACICKQHPDQEPGTLLRTFFRTFSKWKWPKAVSIGPVQKDPPEGFPASMPVWDPQENPRDAKHLMPILTPAYPAMNSAYNVGVPQLRRIQEEMITAARILESGENSWRDLFADSDFFNRHSNFVQVSISANNLNDFLPWHRFCESRLRLLISALETTQISAWPFARFFKREFTKFGKVRNQQNQLIDDSCKRESFFFIALRFSPGVHRVDLRFHISDFLQKMNSWEERKEGMDLAICHVLHQDLPAFVYEPVSNNQVHASINHGSHSRPTGTDPSLQLLEESSTKLTPKMARSTVVDEESGLKSPTKKAKSETSSFD